MTGGVARNLRTNTHSAPSVGFAAGARAFIPGRAGLGERPTFGTAVPPGEVGATPRSGHHNASPAGGVGAAIRSGLHNPLPLARFRRCHAPDPTTHSPLRAPDDTTFGSPRSIPVCAPPTTARSGTRTRFAHVANLRSEVPSGVNTPKRVSTGEAGRGTPSGRQPAEWGGRLARHSDIRPDVYLSSATTG